MALMAERVDKPELVGRVARRLDRDGETVAEVVDGFLEAISAALKGGEGVSLRGFGSFYVRAERDSWVFKFNTGWPRARPEPIGPAIVALHSNRALRQ
jgi:DNA-binding protein HU-beta